MLAQLWTWLLAASPLAVLAAFALAFLAVLLVLQQIRPDDDRAPLAARLGTLRGKLGMPGLPLWLVAVAAVVWTAILVLLLYGVIVLIWTMLAEAPPQDEGAAWGFRFHLAQLAAITAVLGAVVAFPVTLNRLRLTSEDNETKLQGHITERINRAVENLGATRNVRRHRVSSAGYPRYDKDEKGKLDYTKPVFEELTEPNLEVRIGAIYALERIAQDSLRDHVQIMEILTAYVRENAKAEDAEDYPEPDWKPLPDDASDEEKQAHELEFQLRFNTLLFESKAWKWAETLKCRTDIQAALTVIGRRSATQIERETADTRQSEDGYRLDLRATNLQRIDLSNLNFAQADFREAHLEGAVLVEAQLERAYLFKVHLEGAHLFRATLTEVNLGSARLEGAHLGATHLGGAHLTGAHLGGARLTGANLEKASLDRAQFEGASLDGAHLERANLSEAQLKRTDLIGAHLDGASLTRAVLEGADLTRSNLKRANLTEAQLDHATNFSDADTSHASVKWLDLTNTRLSKDQINAMFGDASVILPETIPRPAHWPNRDLEPFDFLTEWHLYKSDPAAYIPPQDRPDPGPS